MAGMLGHKILSHFRRGGESSSPSQPQQQQEQGQYPGALPPRPPMHPPQSQPQQYPEQLQHQGAIADIPAPHTWTLSAQETPLHEGGGTYPRLCRLSDGTLLCVVTQVKQGIHMLKVSKSIDNGNSFTPHGEIARGPGDIDNGFLLEVPEGGEGGNGGGGVVLAAFRNHARGQDGKPTHFRITVCRSHDGGRTWRFASQAAEQSAQHSQGLGLWEPFMRLVYPPHQQQQQQNQEQQQPVVQLTYSGELSPRNQETFLVSSHDSGQTWSSPPTCLRCHAHTESLRDGMQGIASTWDTHFQRPALVMVFETTRQHPHFSLEYVVSYDEGQSWGYRGRVYSPHSRPNSPARDAGSPQIAACKGGKMAVVFMTDEDVEQPKWPRNAAVKAVFADGLVAGRIGWSEHATLVSTAPAHWPGVLCTDEQEVMAVYEVGGRPVGRRIRVGE
ncbi:glycoside hydrolase family 93 protein [Nemania sp. FL0916]|nr:glycoside hydrolase family 93 protein [Nemania sp. FL0916]